MNLFVGAASKYPRRSGVFLSTDNGTSWNAVNNGLTDTSVNVLTASGTNLFAGTNSGVFLSNNNGTSWTAINTGMTNTIVNALAIIGTNIFAGTNSGVFLSTNNGASWSAINNGLTNTSVYAFAVSGTNLFVGENSWYVIYTKLKWFSPVNSVTETWPVNASVDTSTILSPLLAWNADSNAAKYHLQVSIDSTFTSVALDSSVLTTNLQYPGRLVGNTIYYWRVNTSNYVGTSTWSSIWHFTTCILPPKKLSPLAGNSKITLTWSASASPNINKYKIYRGTSSPASTIHDSTTTTSYIDTGLTNGAQYLYRITT
jgi:hypothetical protein